MRKIIKRLFIIGLIVGGISYFICEKSHNYKPSDTLDNDDGPVLDDIWDDEIAKEF